MKKYDDNLEKYLTAIFSVVGISVIITNLSISGFSTKNILTAIQDISGIIVVIAVFLVANKLFIKRKKVDFVSLFETYLNEWISDNNYLISDITPGEGKGKFNKRFCSMVIDHSNIATKRKLANKAIVNKEIGAFVYLPIKEANNDKYKPEFDFRFNERTFERRGIYKKEDGTADLKEIMILISNRINDNFENIGITSKPNPSKKTITVSFEKMEQSKENARRLLDVIEFVKTLVLAIA